MCLRNLFGGEANCSWLLFIIVILLLIDNNDCCDDGCYNARNNGCGCGCLFFYNMKGELFHVFA